MLVIGDGSFNTIGFQTDGKTTKFKIITKMPGEKTADRTDRYEKTGFSSIQWWYGILILPPPRAHRHREDRCRHLRPAALEAPFFSSP